MNCVRLQCDFCGRAFKRRAIDVIRNGPPFFCGRTCSGLHRRQWKTEAARKAEKSAYDRVYRAKNLRRIKRGKAAWFQRTYDPVKAREVRKANMPRHVEYCRQPHYRRYKHKYDLQRRAKLNFGPYADCSLLLRKIESEVGKRATDYEIRLQQGTLNKMQQRRRKLYEKTTRR